MLPEVPIIGSPDFLIGICFFRAALDWGSESGREGGWPGDHERNMRRAFLQPALGHMILLRMMSRMLGFEGSAAMTEPDANRSDRRRALMQGTNCTGRTNPDRSFCGGQAPFAHRGKETRQPGVPSLIKYLARSSHPRSHPVV